MKAISTKYLGPTNFRGSRIKAIEPDGKFVILSYDHALNADANHREAAIALCRELDWHGVLIQGSTKTGYVFVFHDAWPPEPQKD